MCKPLFNELYVFAKLLYQFGGPNVLSTLCDGHSEPFKTGCIVVVSSAVLYVLSLVLGILRSQLKVMYDLLIGLNQLSGVSWSHAVENFVNHDKNLEVYSFGDSKASAEI